MAEIDRRSTYAFSASAGEPSARRKMRPAQASKLTRRLAP